MFAGAEILVRAFGRYNTPDTLRDNSLRFLPSIFMRHRLAPNQHVRVDEAWGLKQGLSPSGRVYRINQQGCRGAPVAQPKPAGEVRVVVLGGSSVFDLYATEGEDWPHRVGERLAAMGHGEVVVVNAGVPGHASFDSLGRLYAQIWTFEPDFVLLYGAWNDIKYLPDLTPAAPLLERFTPYDPQADPFQSYQGFFDRVLSHSQLYVKARTQYLLWAFHPGLEGQIRAGGPERTHGQMGLAQYRLNIELIVDAARNIRATPVLMTEATLAAPDNDENDRALINSYGRLRMTNETLIRAFQDCNDVIRSVASSKGTPLLDLAARFSGRRELFEDHVHTSAAGSAALAEAVATFLATRLGEQR